MQRVSCRLRYERLSLTRVELQKVFQEEKSGHLYFLQRLYRMQCLGYNVKISVFLPSGRLWEVVAYDRWSHMKFRL